MHPSSAESEAEERLAWLNEKLEQIIQACEAGCTPISLGENDSIIRSIRLESGGGRASRLIGSFGNEKLVRLQGEAITKAPQAR